VVTPQLTEGPYFVDELIYRSDIRSDPTTGQVKGGVPLYLNFLVSQAGGNACAPLSGAAVDVWHCDAAGVYSDVNDPGFNTKGQKFLRGTQHTDDSGAAQFLTIYPGWYQGRTVHIHFKVRTDPGASTGYTFTSQLFFDDALSDQVFAVQPYAAKGGNRSTRNANDGIYQQSGGQLTLDVKLTDDGQTYTATFAVGVDLSAPQQPSGPGGPGGSGGPGGPPPGGPPPGSAQ
jgi:protocatechuate 3,4-dioxygenase beta subunit